MSGAGGAAGSAPAPRPTGSTRVAAVIGDPIRHSLSPAIHNAAFAALGLDWVFLAFEVADGDVPRALDGMRSLGIDGLSVTMPHKDAAAAAVDDLSPDAAALAAVNCISRRGGRLIGHNTDGAGFVAALADRGFDPAGTRCVVLGAGGAARSVVLALARAGAADVCVVNRTAAKAAAAAALAGAAGRIGTPAAVADAQLVVNATSVGMASPSAGAAPGALPLPAGLVTASHTVVDLVVHPVRTAWLDAAAAAGATAVDGVGMLVHQAAIAFELWTGVPAPVAVMDAAARSQLA